MSAPSILRRTLAARVAPCLATCLALATTASVAQPSASEVRPPARAASAPARATPAQAAASAASAAQRVEITGTRDNDTEQRRRSTAAKIVIGREEIDKFGDATVGEVLRRLPGVSTPGAPGRGGPPRLRGLGNGFTQLLIDGQRIPPGFSLESLTPEQVERIEILRAPTAETGARAIAGTINIITREGFKRRLNDLRLGFGYENGKVSPGINWTHNDTAGPLTYNISGSAFNPHRQSSNTSTTTVTDASTGALLEDHTTHSSTTESRVGANLTSRLQWRLGDSGDMLALTPSIFHTQARSRTVFNLVQGTSRPCAPGQVEGCTADFFDNGTSSSDSRFTNGRLNGQWRQRVGNVRLELNGGGGLWRAANHTLRNEFGTATSTSTRYPRSYDDSSTSSETSYTLNLKGSGLTAGNADGGEHSLVSGLEIDGAERRETKVSTINGAPQNVDFDSNLKARSLRLAAFAQDEWALSSHWGAHAGLRWEGITTEGDNGQGDHPTNRSSVWTPLLHAVWKPDPKGRDQVRFSLTRSYRSPNLGTLIARPSISRLYPVSATTTNTFTSPDSAGNPQLKPELATGIDIALERYLDAGGVLSANLFHRNISNLMRARVQLENVSWSPGQPRYVRRTQNIGDATTSGLELEAKFRLDQLITGATPIELRSNVSVYTSRVSTVPGPDNRLDQQAKASANFGGDYRLRGLPLTLGGNVNWVPGYTTRDDINVTNTVSTKQVWDAYALWTFSPATALRLLGSNLSARDYSNTGVTDVTLRTASATERNTVRSTGPSYVNWQLRLELKL